jgi:hypothetical protein
MSGESLSSISGIGNGWKDPYSTSTHNMLKEDFRCLKTRHFLGKRRRTNPVAFCRSTLEGTGKCAVAPTTNLKDVGAPTRSALKQAGDPSYTAPKRWQPELLVETLESPNAPKIATQAS